MDAKELPSFCWDRNWSHDDIKRRLSAASSDEWVRLAAWIMREARFCDVWKYISVQQVSARLPELKKYLHNSRDFWEYIIGSWHELGHV